MNVCPTQSCQTLLELAISMERNNSYIGWSVQNWSQEVSWLSRWNEDLKGESRRLAKFKKWYLGNRPNSCSEFQMKGIKIAQPIWDSFPGSSNTQLVSQPVPEDEYTFHMGKIKFLAGKQRNIPLIPSSLEELKAEIQKEMQKLWNWGKHRLDLTILHWLRNNLLIFLGKYEIQTN